MFTLIIHLYIIFLFLLMFVCLRLIESPCEFYYAKAAQWLLGSHIGSNTRIYGNTYCIKKPSPASTQQLTHQSFITIE